MLLEEEAGAYHTILFLTEIAQIKARYVPSTTLKIWSGEKPPNPQ